MDVRRSPGDWRVPLAQDPRWRLARGVVVGTSAALLSVAGHVSAGGHLAPTAVLVLTLLLVAGGVLQAGRELRFAPMLGLLLVAQLGTHVVLSFSGGHAVAASGGHALASASSTVRGAPPVDPTSFSLTPGMLVGHAVAALLIAALLRWGERILWGLAALLLSSLGVVLPSPAPVSAPTRVLIGLPGAESRQVVWLASCAARRGPPVRLAA